MRYFPLPVLWIDCAASKPSLISSAPPSGTVWFTSIYRPLVVPLGTVTSVLGVASLNTS